MASLQAYLSNSSGELDLIRLQHRLSTVLQLLAFGVALYLAVRIFWLIVPTPEISTPLKLLPTVQPAPTVVVSQAAKEAGQGLKNTWLFGQPGKKAALPQITKPAPKRQLKPLNLKLTGIVYASDQQLARAMLSHKKESGNFKVGDFVPGGQGILVSIEPDHIVVGRGDKLEPVYLYGNKEKAEPEKQPSTAPQLIDDRRKRAEVTKIAGQYFSQLITDPSSLVELVSLRAVRQKGGKFVGYRIESRRNFKDFSMLGLQNNDIVQSINGVSLSSLVGLNEARQSMIKNNEVSFLIQRSDKDMELKVRLR